MAARTHPGTLPRLRRVGATEARSWVSAVRPDVTGGMLFWDGQLEDDARLVVAVARTAAAHGARILTRVRARQRDRRLGPAARRAHRRGADGHGAGGRQRRRRLGGRARRRERRRQPGRAAAAVQGHSHRAARELARAPPRPG